jgi:hypothetical protein
MAACLGEFYPGPLWVVQDQPTALREQPADPQHAEPHGTDALGREGDPR